MFSPASFVKLDQDKLFEIAQDIVARAPGAVEAAQQDVLAEWSVDLDPAIVAGLLTCGIVLFFSIMQQVAVRHAAAKGESNE